MRCQFAREKPVSAATTMSAALFLVTSFLAGTPAQARRLPSPGHKVTLALPLDVLPATRAAHLYAYLVELPAQRSPSSSLAHPPLPGAAPWTSVILSSVTSDPEYRVWRLSPRENPELVRASVELCFAPQNGERDWPARVLRAAKVRTTVGVEGDDVIVHFDHPVGPIFDLLAGCPLRDESGTPTGAFFPPRLAS